MLTDQSPPGVAATLIATPASSAADTASQEGRIAAAVHAERIKRTMTIPARMDGTVKCGISQKPPTKVPAMLPRVEAAKIAPEVRPIRAGSLAAIFNR